MIHIVRNFTFFPGFTPWCYSRVADPDVDIIRINCHREAKGAVVELGCRGGDVDVRYTDVREETAEVVY